MLQRFDWPITTTALMHRGMKWRTISSGLLLTTLPISYPEFEEKQVIERNNKILDRFFEFLQVEGLIA